MTFQHVNSLQSSLICQKYLWWKLACVILANTRQNWESKVILQIAARGGWPTMNLHLSNSISSLDFSSPSAKVVFTEGELCAKKCITQTHYELLLASNNTEWSTLVLHLMMHFQLSSGASVSLAVFIAVFIVSGAVNSVERKMEKKNVLSKFIYYII